MCGRYWIEAEENTRIQQIVGALVSGGAQVKTAGEIFPGDRVPVLCKSRAGNIRPFAMEWGYRMESGGRVINARSESAANKPMFRDGMRQRRCLLPMSAYFEWANTLEGRVKYRIAPAEDAGLICLAGLYRFEQDAPVCTVLTTAARREIAMIHPRMPVILTEAEGEAWLNGAELDCNRSMAMAFRQA